jgi:hypothetical protein
MQSRFDPETFLRHARQGAPITTETEEAISSLVAESINRYLENWDNTFERESSRLSRILDGLNKALAAIIAKEWTYTDDEVAPFHDETSAYAWLSAKGEEPVYIGGQDDFIVGGREE